jgi:antitoxin MazE
MIIKKLTRSGNSAALVIDRTLMRLMDIDGDTELKITVEGRKMTVEPLTKEERGARVSRSIRKTGTKNAELFRRLAK